MAIAGLLESYVFGPSGFYTKAPLRYASKFDPFLSLDFAGVEGVGAQILTSGNLGVRDPMHVSKISKERNGRQMDGSTG